MYFWEPFLTDVFKGGRGSDGEANEEDVSLWVREGAQSIIVFLTCCVEKT